MAWSDVPAKLSEYEDEEYAPPRARERLLAAFDATRLSDVAVERRVEFEEALDYRLGACVNLRKSRLMRGLNGS